MGSKFILNKLFISFFLLVAVLVNTATVSFAFPVKNITVKDNAVLTRLFCSSDMYLSDISKVFQNNVIVSKTQTTPIENSLEKGTLSDIIFTGNYNFFNNNASIFYFSLVVMALFLFNCFVLTCFNFDMWRCIVFLLIFKMLFNILPRSISIKTLLNTKSLCFVC